MKQVLNKINPRMIAVSKAVFLMVCLALLAACSTSRKVEVSLYDEDGTRVSSGVYAVAERGPIDTADLAFEHEKTFIKSITIQDGQPAVAEEGKFKYGLGAHAYESQKNIRVQVAYREQMPSSTFPVDPKNPNGAKIDLPVISFGYIDVPLNKNDRLHKLGSNAKPLWVEVKQL